MNPEQFFILVLYLNKLNISHNLKVIVRISMTFKFKFKVADVIFCDQRISLIQYFA